MAAAKKQQSKGEWIDILWLSVGKYANLETVTGVNRAGKVSGLRSKVIKFNGQPQDVITELELNGDPTDTVSLSDLVSITID